jgi:hypothetical protein
MIHGQDLQKTNNLLQIYPFFVVTVCRAWGGIYDTSSDSDLESELTTALLRLC